MDKPAQPSAGALAMNAGALNDFLDEAFPNRQDGTRGVVVTAVPGHVRMQLMTGDVHLRPGGIVSGPTQMALADSASYALVLAHVGPVAMAVTSALNYQFLRPCRPGLLTADGRLLRLGRRSVVINVQIWTDDEAKPVGQASVTYMLP
jgi:uncharacterized protein (TIGR00369 family)